MRIFTYWNFTWLQKSKRNSCIRSCYFTLCLVKHYISCYRCTVLNSWRAKTEQPIPKHPTIAASQWAWSHTTAVWLEYTTGRLQGHLYVTYYWGKLTNFISLPGAYLCENLAHSATNSTKRYTVANMTTLLADYLICFSCGNYPISILITCKYPTSVSHMLQLPH